MEREERIRRIARDLYNSLFEIGDISCGDMACAITYLASVMDRIIEEEDNTKSGAF